MAGSHGNNSHLSTDEETSHSEQKYHKIPLTPTLIITSCQLVLVAVSKLDFRAVMNWYVAQTAVFQQN